MAKLNYSKVHRELCQLTYSRDTFKQKLEEALKAGFPVDYIPSRGEKRETLLHITLTDEFSIESDIPEILIEKGADVNIRDSMGWTALHTSLGQEVNMSDRVQKILDAGADVNAVVTGGDMKGLTAFFLAAYNFCNDWDGHDDDIQDYEYEIFKVLLDNGADPYLYNIWEFKQTDGLGPYFDYRREELQKYVESYLAKKAELSDQKTTPGYDYEI